MKIQNNEKKLVGVGLGGGVRVDVNEELRGSGGGLDWWGGQGGCEHNVGGRG